MSRYREKSCFQGSRVSTATLPDCKKSPCFRTTSDGRIALIPNWEKLLSGAAKLPRVSLQTRHNFARLVSTVSLNELIALASDEPNKATLMCQPETWHQAWGRVAFCPCCQSPGRVEICNQYGLDVLQICAFPEHSIEEWADYIGQNYSPDTGTASADQLRRNQTPLEFPKIPTNAIAVAITGHSLLTLFEIARHDRIPVEATLDSGSTQHLQLMALSRATVDNGILSLRSPGAHAQIALPSVHSLAVSSPAGYQHLHLVGANHACLFTFTAHPSRLDDWDDALATLFPKLR